MEIGPMLNIVANLGAFGLLTWVIMYWGPEMTRKHAAAVERLAMTIETKDAAHKASVAEITVAYKEAMAAERAACERWFDRLVGVIETNQQDIARLLATNPPTPLRPS